MADEQDGNDIEDEIGDNVSELSRCVQRLDHKVYELMRVERTEEELEELKAANEVLNRDQDVVKKQLKEFQIEFGDNKGLEPDMYGWILEKEIEDSNRVEDFEASERKKLNETQSDSDRSGDQVELDYEISTKPEGLEQKMCRLMSDFGENVEEFEALVAGIKGFIKEEEYVKLCDLIGDIGDDLQKKLKQMKKEFDRSGGGDGDGTGDRAYANVEGLIQQLCDLLIDAGNNLKEKLEQMQKMSARSDDGTEHEVYALFEGLEKNFSDLTIDIGSGLKKKLIEMPKELNRSICGTENEVYATVEGRIQKFCDLMSDIGNDLKEELEEKQKESDMADNHPDSEAFTNVEGLEQKMCGLMRKNDESTDNFEVLRAGPEGYKNEQKDDEKRSSEMPKVSEQIGLEFVSNTEELEQKYIGLMSVDGNFKQVLTAVMAEIGGSNKEDELGMRELMHGFEKSREKFEKEEDDVKRKNLGKMLKNNVESDEKIEVVKMLSDRVVELETEISGLQIELTLLTSEKEEAATNFQQLKSELEELKQSNCGKELEIVDLVKNKITALLEPADHKMRAKIETVVQSQIDEILIKEKEDIESTVDHQMRNRLEDPKVAIGEKPLDADKKGPKGLKLIWSATVVITGAVAALGALFYLGNAKPNEQTRSKD